MIEGKVPKDIRTYETKAIGPFTFRQILLIGLAIFVDLILFFYVCRPLDIKPDSIVYILVFIDMGILAFSKRVFFGMYLEKYIKIIVFDNFLASKYRLNENKLYVNEKKYTDKEKKTLEKKRANIEKLHPELKGYE